MSCGEICGMIVGPELARRNRTSHSGPDLRVLHIVTAFPRFPTDPITPWFVELVRRQRESGIDARVFAPAYRGGPEIESFPEIPVQRFRYAPPALETLTHDESVPDRIRHSPAALGLIPTYLAGGLRAAHDAGHAQPDVVQVHWPMPHALFGAAVRRGSGDRTAVVCSYYSVELNWVTQTLRPLLPFLRWTARTADAVTAISNSTGAAVQQLTDEPVHIVPYGTGLDDDGSALTRPILSGDGPVKILFVGRLVERKGVEVLVRALAGLASLPDAELTVIGAGERAGLIERTARVNGVADRVHLRGSVTRDELVRNYTNHDLFVLPAVVDAKGDTEGLGVVLLEALRFERAVIASDLGGIPDIIEHERTGLLVPPGDAAALGAAIESLVRHPERARAMAKVGRQVASDRFGWDRVLDSTNQVYSSAIARRHGA
jgi:glycosyltransferase involved in cell wall biosynthesis